MSQHLKIISTLKKLEKLRHRKTSGNFFKVHSRKWQNLGRAPETTMLGCLSRPGLSSARSTWESSSYSPFLPTSTGTMIVRSSVFLINYSHLTVLSKFFLSPIQSVLHKVSRLLSLKWNIILSFFLLNSLQQFLISSWIISKLKLKYQYFGHLMRRADSLEKTLLLGKIEGRRSRGREDEMVGWHHRLDGREFEQALGDGEGQWSLACCSPWGRKELDTTERLNWTILKWDNPCKILVCLVT